tara:strand:+ start:237 stop:356 length:120 start_codon:yes stop_codon:yes gene_type:complete
MVQLGMAVMEINGLLVLAHTTLAAAAAVGGSLDQAEQGA